MKLIMENWKNFLKEEIDWRLTPFQIEQCRNKGYSVKLGPNRKASDCSRRGYKTPECGPQVGEYDNEMWCPPGYRCNMTATCVPCHGGWLNHDRGPMSKYSNCKGDKKLSEKVFYKDKDFQVFYDPKQKKIRVKKFHDWGARTHPDVYSRAKEKLKLAKDYASKQSQMRLGMTDA